MINPIDVMEQPGHLLPLLDRDLGGSGTGRLSIVGLDPGVSATSG